MERIIRGFRLDPVTLGQDMGGMGGAGRAGGSGSADGTATGDWIVEFACGHHQHVRHRPPWESRPWVVTEEGRKERIGKRLPCGTCEKLVLALPPRARERVVSLELMPHPEGGFFRETYRASLSFDLEDSDGKAPKRTRAASTAIYFLIPKGSFSAFHRIRSDEVWHFYEGAPLEVIMLDGGGRRSFQLGTDFGAGALPQGVVPAGSWFASRLADDSDERGYALVGCTVAPGFDFADFELADRDTLAAEFPEHRPEITSLTRVPT